MSEPGTEWKRRVFGAGYVTPEQRRERDIDAAVREGLNSLGISIRILALDETVGIYSGVPRVPAWFADVVKVTWREQHV